VRTAERRVKNTGSVSKCELWSGEPSIKAVYLSAKEGHDYRFAVRIVRSSIPVYNQKNATLHSLLVTENCSTYFEWYLHSSSGTYTILSAVSVIFHTVTATFFYRGGVGTAVPTPPR
jgi:hypothetical protein